MTQLAEMRAAARRFFLKSSIPEKHKRGKHPSDETVPLKTNPGPNRKHKIPIMSLEGGWVGERTQSKGRPAPPPDHLPRCTVAGRPHGHDSSGERKRVACDA